MYPLLPPLPSPLPYASRSGNEYNTGIPAPMYSSGPGGGQNSPDSRPAHVSYLIPLPMDRYLASIPQSEATIDFLVNYKQPTYSAGRLPPSGTKSPIPQPYMLHTYPSASRTEDAHTLAISSPAQQAVGCRYGMVCMRIAMAMKNIVHETNVAVAHSAGSICCVSSGLFVICESLKQSSSPISKNLFLTQRQTGR